MEDEEFSKEDREKLDKFISRIKSNFIKNASDPFKLSLIYSVLMIICFLCGMLTGAIYYSNVANDEMQDILNAYAKENRMHYLTMPEEARAVFDKYNVTPGIEFNNNS
jgi:hypothetical protein